MPVKTERLPRSLIALTIEVEDERLEASLKKAVRKVSREVKIPGFRPGKAPRELVERTVGRPALIQEALDQLLPSLYNEALESEAIEAIGQPEFELESMEPVIVHAKVPVRPTVELNDYAALRAPRPPVELKPEQVDESLTALRRRFATLEPADRAVQWGDSVRADVTVAVEGQDEAHEEEDAEFRVEEDTVVSLPGFLDRLIGLERGGPYELSFDLPEDFEAPELAGKTAHYTLTIHEVKQEVLPELDDDFVRSLDEDGVETVEALRERAERDVLEHVEAESLAQYHDEVLDLLLAGGELDYPEVLVEQEVDRLIDRESNHASHTAEELEKWLEEIGKTEQEVRDELAEAAEMSVRRALVLGEFVSQEALTVSEERIDEEMNRLVDGMLGGVDDAEQRETLRGVIDNEAARESMRERLTTEMALERLVEICSQPEEETAARARGSRRRRGSRAGADGEAAAAEAEAPAGDEPSGEPPQERSEPSAAAEDAVAGAEQGE